MDSRSNQNAAGHNKVAIPRLHPYGPHGAAKTPATGLHRVAHACEPCRIRKTKCSGERPTCKHCQSVNAECYYADGKRDKFKREYDLMRKQLAAYETILKNNNLGQYVNHTFRYSYKHPSPESPRSRRNTINKQSPDLDNDNMNDNDDDDNNSDGSLESLDKLDEDFVDEPESRETGYVGKASEVSWMRRLDQEHKDGATSDGDEDGWGMSTGTVVSPFSNTQSTGDQRSQGRSGSAPFQDSSHHHGKTDFLQVIKSSDEWLKPEEWVVRRALGYYFDIVHPIFPLIPKQEFIGRVNDLYASEKRPHDERSWFAQLNLVLAIAGNYLASVGDVLDPQIDPTIYFARGYGSVSRGHVLTLTPDHDEILAMGLIVFYLTCVNQINRAWILAGRTIRFCIAVGFHLDSEPLKLKEEDREKRYRVWWSIYSLDRLLSIMTGRPAALTLGDFSTPLPRPVSEEDLTSSEVGLPRIEMHQVLQSAIEERQANAELKGRTQVTTPMLEVTIRGMEGLSDLPPNDALYFRCQIQLDLIAQHILSSLYRLIGHTQLHALGHSPIANIDSKLEDWRLALPPAFDFTRKQTDYLWARHRIRLGFSFYGTRIILHRPLLCDVKKTGFRPRVKQNTKDLAAECIRSASAMLSLVPDMGAKEILALVPWFSFVHYVVQAVAVLLIELDMGAHTLPDERDKMLRDAKRGVMLLHRVSSHNDAAAKAFKVTSRNLRRIAPKVKGSTDDMPDNLPPTPLQSQYNNPEPRNVMVVPPAANMEDLDWYLAQPMRSGFGTQILSMPMDPVSMVDTGLNWGMSVPIPDYNDLSSYIPALPFGNVMDYLHDYDATDDIGNVVS